jgi:hypothetical protein
LEAPITVVQVAPEWQIHLELVPDPEGSDVFGFSASRELDHYSLNGLALVGRFGLEIRWLTIKWDFGLEGGVDSRTMRAISISSLKTAIRTAIEELVSNDERWRHLTSVARVGRIPELDLHVARLLHEGMVAGDAVGRRGHPDELYEWVARRYIALAREGQTKGLRRVLSQEASTRLKHFVSESTIGDWLHRARELGFLAKTQPGRVVGEPGLRLSEEGGNTQ